jgi:hypothetical protein
MIIVPVINKPAQTMSITLGGQATVLRVYEKFYGLYIDILVNDVLVIGGVVARDRNRIVRSTYLGYIGDLSFFDTQGSHDPNYAELGVRYLLGYFTQDELAQFGIT